MSILWIWASARRKNPRKYFFNRIKNLKIFWNCIFHSLFMWWTVNNNKVIMNTPLAFLFLFNKANIYLYTYTKEIYSKGLYIIVHNYSYVIILDKQYTHEYLGYMNSLLQMNSSNTFIKQPIKHQVFCTYFILIYWKHLDCFENGFTISIFLQLFRYTTIYITWIIFLRWNIKKDRKSDRKKCFRNFINDLLCLSCSFM